MKTVADKILAARTDLNLTQDELAEKIGVSRRSVAAYERGESLPRKSTILKLGKVLKVSTKYLSDESIEDPLFEIERDIYYEDAMERYGTAGVKDMQELLEQGRAYLAGGEVPQEEKDVFFEALAEVYYAAKAEAKIKFGRKDK